MLCACGGSSVEGTYYNVDNANEYIELKGNGEFYLKAGPMDFSGKYAVDGKTIILNPKTNMAAIGRLENGTIVDSDGTRWKKR
jgi:hypothetical protein